MLISPSQFAETGSYLASKHFYLVPSRNTNQSHNFKNLVFATPSLLLPTGNWLKVIAIITCYLTSRLRGIQT